MAKTPQDAALTAVTKAIQDYDKAVEKHETAQKKADELKAARERANRTVTWTASHPDLPADFDVVAFAEELRTPFEDEDNIPEDRELDEDAIPTLQDVVESEVGVSEDQITIPDDASEIVDDPFGDDEPAETPQARRR